MIHKPLALARRLLAGLCIVVAGFASAAAPQQQTQVPGYYRLQVGAFEVTALYDGAIDLDEKLLKNVQKRDVQRLLARQFLQGPKVQTAVNAYLVNTGSKLVLVDAGAAKLFGPGLGNIVANLEAAGYKPEQVDTVLVTHLHGDHVNGLVTPEGKAVFANAEIWSAKADNDFWLSETIAAQAPAEAQGFFKMARDAAAPYRAAGRWQTFDSDPKQAVVARKRIFAQAAREKLMIAGMHLPFPGIGHVRREAKGGYAWVPAEFAPLAK